MTTTKARKLPDGVANIRVDQGWGSAQIMGAVRHIHDKTIPGRMATTTASAGRSAAALRLGIPGGWRVRLRRAATPKVRLPTSRSDSGGFGDFDGPTATTRTSRGRFVPASPVRCSIRTSRCGRTARSSTSRRTAASRRVLTFWASRLAARWTRRRLACSIGPEFAYNSLDVDDGDADDDERTTTTSGASCGAFSVTSDPCKDLRNWKARLRPGFSFLRLERRLFVARPIDVSRRSALAKAPIRCSVGSSRRSGACPWPGTVSCSSPG